LIPQLEDGVLPEGIHDCSLKECQDAFGKFTRSDRRSRLSQALASYVSDAAASGIAVAVLIDGSYVTAKLEPNDIDLILVLRADFDPAIELRPMEYNVQSKRAVKKRYGLTFCQPSSGVRRMRNMCVCSPKCEWMIRISLLIRQSKVC
jgi:hypothetical protein